MGLAMQESTATSTQRLRRVAVVTRYATGLLLLVMFIGTHIPITTQRNIIASDKTIHLVAYTILTVFVLASWEFSTGMLRPTHYFFVWLCGTVYGAFDEITQIPVGRTCDGMDWLADIVGIVIGLTLFRIVPPTSLSLDLISPINSSTNQKINSEAWERDSLPYESSGTRRSSR